MAGQSPITVSDTPKPQAMKGFEYQNLLETWRVDDIYNAFFQHLNMIKNREIRNTRD